MPLDADAKPAWILRFDRLNDSIRRAGTDPQPRGHLPNRLMMAAVNAHLAATIDLLQPRLALEQERVAMGFAG